ncbi:DUF3275 family protein [Citrobacter sp. S2-9]|uniref:DUF3275 family protein n=1 Tax=Citrobacter enshiensis TaxID=2971264 RepID=A0ABT8PVA6_9ENTR|nr:DUF3275 family protein [Citrobacter enshiensis]MDN8600286.1 DUF3275 family protein [Citrobacter enshiensis]
MNTASHLPVIVDGKLVIKTINGRNGAFNVGLLETGIGSFSVKDRELEQYPAGVYQGQFVIGRIFMHSWSYGANSGTEIRARLDEMNIETNDILHPGDEQKMLPPVSDPLDEENRIPEQSGPAPDSVADTPVPITRKGRSRQFTVPTPAEQESDDQVLFGALWPLGDIVKLDAAAPRQILRQQTARLGLLGYEFSAQEQHFIKTTVAETRLH